VGGEGLTYYETVVALAGLMGMDVEEWVRR